jgi:hypothetical protein
MVEVHYFEIIMTILSSNWNSITSGFYHTTHLMWLQAPAVQAIVITRDKTLVLGCTIFFACSESCASLKRNLFRYRF